MFRKAVSLICAFLISGCSCPGAVLNPSPECVEGSKKECNPGPCPGAGVAYCIDGEWDTCDGWQEPEVEICDLIDNDCDGTTDIGMTDPRLGTMCGFTQGRCRIGTNTCILGYVACLGDYLGPTYETCNSVDDDCDGDIDEGLEQKVCYTGPENTKDEFGVPQGICHSGVSRCVFGSMSNCEGEKGPEPKDCSNAKDNDCDGVVDVGEDAEPIDLVLLVDQSGSMFNAIMGVIQGIVSFLQTAQAAGLDVRVAVIGVPGTRLGGCGSFGDFQLIPDAINTVNLLNSNQGGAEPTLECLYGLVHPYDPFELSWREGTQKIAILFTDEICDGPWCVRDCGSAAALQWCDEAGFSDTHKLTVAEVADAYEFSDITVHGFIKLPIQSWYQPIMDKNGGQMIGLSTLAKVVADNLYKLLVSLTC